MGYVMPVAILTGNEVRSLQQLPDGSLVLTGLDRSSTHPDPLVIRSFVIQRLSARPLASIDGR